jgi:tetratricopeptide (TPR) repeat protein
MHQRIKWLALMLCIWTNSAYSISVIEHAENLLARHQPEKAYQWLNQHKQQLNSSAKDLYVYGLLALRLGHKQQAFIALEQVVTLAPNNLAAQLDLAIAAIQVGRLIQADRLLSSLAQREGNPNGVDLLIAHYRMKINDQLQPLHYMTTKVKLGAGYNDNVNLGLLGKQIELDTVNGKLTLNIDALNMAIGDQYHHASLTHQRTWGNPNQTDQPWPNLTITAQGKVKTYGISQQYNTASMELSIAKALTFLAQPSQLSLTTQLLTLGDQVSQDWRVKATTLLPSSKIVELQLDQQDKASIQLSSNAPWLGDRAQWFVGLEKYKARSSFLGATISWAVHNDVHLDSGLNYTVSEDVIAYSPNVFGDKKKKTQTLVLNTNLWRPIGKNKSVYLNLMWQDQSSNIALFRTRSAAMEIGITKEFK